MISELSITDSDFLMSLILGLYTLIINKQKQYFKIHVVCKYIYHWMDMQIDRGKQLSKCNKSEHDLRRLQSEVYYATAIPHASTPHKSDFIFP